MEHEEEQMAYEGAQEVSKAERERPAVMVQVDRLEETVGRVRSLRDKLSLVLRPQGPELAEDVPRENPNRVSDRLGNAVNEIHRVLEDIEQRLEV